MGYLVQACNKFITYVYGIKFKMDFYEDLITFLNCLTHNGIFSPGM